MTSKVPSSIRTPKIVITDDLNSSVYIDIDDEVMLALTVYFCHTFDDTALAVVQGRI